MTAELVNRETGEIVSHGSVRESIAIARSYGEKFFEQIVWQVENETWTILGYKSWDEMREAEYADTGVVAPRADRPELVSRLRSKGLTQKQIGDTIGVSDRGVSKILNRTNSVEDRPSAPAITNSRGQQRPTAYQPRPTPVPEPEDDIVEAELVDEDSYREAPAPTPRNPVLAGNNLYKYDAQKRVEHLGWASMTMWAATNPDRRAEYIQSFRDHPEGTSPATRAYMTPDHFRRYAAAFNALADEWTQQ